MKKKIIHILALLCASFSAKAQSLEGPAAVNRIIPAEPEAAALGTYGNLKLNLSTGQAEIGVPIVELKGPTINYPISLSYDHRGIKVDDRATFAGMNWTLNAAGVITRTVAGLPDDKPGTGYNYNYGLLANAPTSITPQSFNDTWYLAALGRIDFEPDIFSYNFNGKSGQFFYSPQEDKFYTIPYSKLAIKKVSMPEGGYSFQITDESGYQYYFTLKTQTNFLTSSADNDNGAAYDGQWYLTRIAAPNGTIEFELEYINNNLGFDVVTTNQSRRYLQNRAGAPCAGYNSEFLMLEGTSNSITTVSYSGKLVSKIKTPFEELRFEYAARNDGGLRIDRIAKYKTDQTEMQSWKFYHSYYGGGGKLRLDSLSLMSGSQKINGYKFGYSPGNIPAIGSKAKDLWGYYRGGNPSSLFPKIWYNSQYIGDAERTAVLQYTLMGTLNEIAYPTGGRSNFEYELNDYGRKGNGTATQTPVVTPTSVTLIRSTSQNGAGDTSKTFTITTPTIVHFLTRRDNCNGNQPNGSNCSIEPCQTVMTLSGPNTNISLNGGVAVPYELDKLLEVGTYTIKITTNELMDYGRIQVSYDAVTSYIPKTYAGGLRVKKITDVAPETNISTIRKFSYQDADDPNRPSGYIPAEPIFTYISMSGSNCNISGGGGGLPNCGIQSQYVNFSSESLTNLFYSDGSPVSYTRVLETIGENGEGGTIDHRFSYKNDDINTGFPFGSGTGYSWRRGLPTQTFYYASNGTLAKEEASEYTFETSNNYYDLVGMKYGWFRYCPHMTSFINIIGTGCHQVSQWSYLSKMTTKTYSTNGSGSLTEEVSYFYDNPAHIQPTRVRTQRSDGTTTFARATYAQDYNVAPGSGDFMAAALHRMLQQNLISLPVEQIETSVLNGQEQITSANLQVYKEFMSDGIYPWKSYQLELTAPIPYMALTGISGNAFTQDSRYTRRAEYTAYNNKGKLTQALDETNRSYALLYGYNGLLPIAYAKNAAPNQVYYNGFEESGGGAIAKYGKYGSTAPFSIPSGSVTSGTYLLSWWQYNGSSWQYQSQVLNYSGSGPITVGSIGTIDEVTLRPQSSLINTFSQDPSVGTISKVQDNGSGLKFDFDQIGRLINARDHNNNILKSNKYQYQGN